MTSLLFPPLRHLFYDTTSATWRVDFQQLKQDLEQFDREKARFVFENLCNYLSHWIWTLGNAEQNVKIARIVGGLFTATFNQTIWNWRPQISLVEESHSGKSDALKLFSRIFGNLAVLIEKPTPAGIRQNLRSSATACFIDEFEDDIHRNQILDMIKTSGNGATISRGTADQKGASFQLQHMFWVAAVVVGNRSRYWRAGGRNVICASFAQKDGCGSKEYFGLIFTALKRILRKKHDVAQKFPYQ